MFSLDKKSKLVLAACFIVLLCSVVYTYGYYHGATKDIVKEPPTVQDDAPMPKDTSLGISAELFVPNFNAFADKIKILTFQSTQNDFIKFPNTTRAVTVIGKGNPQNLDCIEVIFPKYDNQAYDDGLIAISATISAVSPSITADGTVLALVLIIQKLGILDDVNNASGMKIYDYNGKRYCVNYDGNKIVFYAMSAPK